MEEKGNTLTILPRCGKSTIISNTTARQGTAQQGNTKPKLAEKRKRQTMPKSKKVTITKNLPIYVRAPKYPLKEEMGQATQSRSLAKADVREQAERKNKIEENETES